MENKKKDILCSYCHHPVGITYYQVDNLDTNKNHIYCTSCFNEFCDPVKRDLKTINTSSIRVHQKFNGEIDSSNILTYENVFSCWDKEFSKAKLDKDFILAFCFYLDFAFSLDNYDKALTIFNYISNGVATKFFPSQVLF